MEVDEIEAGLLEKFSSLQTVDQPGENYVIIIRPFFQRPEHQHQVVG
jgi:hypothetical protein